MPITGRPTKLDQILTRDDDGTPVTTADRIISAIRRGNYLETAAAMAGVSRSALHAWLKDGAEAQRLIEAGVTTRGRLTKRQRLCADFVDAVEQAQATATADDVARLDQLASGGLTTTTTTEKSELDVDGHVKLLERTVKTEVLLPSESAIRWRLERRERQLWGRQTLELTGADGGPIGVEVSTDERALQLAASLAALKAGATTLPTGPQLEASLAPLKADSITTEPTEPK